MMYGPPHTTCAFVIEHAALQNGIVPLTKPKKNIFLTHWPTKRTLGCSFILTPTQLLIPTMRIVWSGEISRKWLTNSRSQQSNLVQLSVTIATRLLGSSSSLLTFKDMPQQSLRKERSSSFYWIFKYISQERSDLGLTAPKNSFWSLSNQLQKKSILRGRQLKLEQFVRTGLYRRVLALPPL